MPSYYSDLESNDSSAPSSAESDEKDAKPKEDKNDDMPTALVPKSLLAGKDFKPGEEIVFKIVHLYDDEVEIEYASSSKKDNKDEYSDSDSEEMSSAMDRMDSAMS